MLKKKAHGSYPLGLLGEFLPQGTHFEDISRGFQGPTYVELHRMFSCMVPVVAAVRDVREGIL